MYDLITCRHSVRKYKDQQVLQEDINKIIEAGLSAPSGQNTQPWHFTVIQNKDVQDELVETCKNMFLEKGASWRKKWALMDNFNPFYNPNVIIVISNNNSIDKSNEDCCFAIENMVLMCESLGLSSCIIRDICWAINKSNQSKYGIPEEYDCFMCISIGYPFVENNSRKKFDYSKVNYIK